MVQALLPALFAFASTLVVGLALIATQSWHGRFSMDSTFGVQKMHSRPTPRIGGVAIAVGLVCGWYASNGETRQIFGYTLLAGIPALLFGLAEDITKEVGVTARLLATMSSGVLAWYLTGVSMQNTGVPWVDYALQYAPLAVLFTAFAVGGVANSINIIDGFNGLAVGSSAIMLGAMGAMAYLQQDLALCYACLLASGCALGFAAVNWPMGRIFLGDGGAYLLGFVLAWFAVLLPMRNPHVNAWGTLLVCAYPVIEVGFSVLRRRRREGHHPGQPDRVHLHHLLHRRVVCKVVPNASKTLQNALTSPFCWFFVAAPAAWGVVFSENTWMLVLGLVLAVTCYSLVYTRLTTFSWQFLGRKK